MIKSNEIKQAQTQKNKREKQTEKEEMKVDET